MKRLSSLVLVAAITVAAVRCSDPGAVGPGERVSDVIPLKGMAISSPFSVGLSTGSDIRSDLNADGGDVVYVSLAPESLPGADRMVIENQTRPSAPTTVAIVNGGFDPVPVRASEGDTLKLTAWTLEVPAQPMFVRVTKRPPSVVRTSPPSGHTDVALNITITVVFGAPVDRSTVTTSSMQLLHDGVPVSGSVVFVGDSWQAVFAPDEPLAARSTYEVVVTREARDLHGDALQAKYTSTFVTGGTECDPFLDRSDCVLPAFDTTNVIAGTVTERTTSGSRPVPYATISPWLQRADGSGQWLNQLESGADGTFSMRSLDAGRGRILFHASVEGLDQPCGVMVWASQGAKADIEVVASGSRAVQRGGSIWGIVSVGSIEAPSVPVVGARIVYEARDSVVAATATTDDNGNFTLCGLPSIVRAGRLTLSKSGYETISWPISPDKEFPGLFASRFARYEWYIPMQPIL